MSRQMRSYAAFGTGFFLLLEAMLVAAILYWPNFEENVEAVKALAPNAFLKKMVDGLAKEGVVAYVNGQHFFKGCNTMGIAAAVLFAMNAVAGEVHRGTLEIWLARPLSRNRILIEKWLAGAAAVCLPVFLTSATVPWLLSFVEEDAPLSIMMLCSVHQSLFLLLVYSVSFFFSCVGEKPVKIAFSLLFFTTFEFAIYLVKDLTYWSIFRVVDLDDFARIVNRAELNWSYVVPMALAILALLGASLFAFRRRVP